MFLRNTFKNTKINKFNKRLLTYVHLDSFHNRSICDSKRICLYSQNENKARIRSRFRRLEFNSNQVKHYSRLTDTKKEDEKSFWKAWLNNATRITYDQVSLARVMSSFQLELLKTMPNVKVYFQTLFTKPQYQYLKEKLEPEFNIESNQNIKNKLEDKITNQEKLKIKKLPKESSQPETKKVDTSNLEFLNNRMKQVFTKVKEDETSMKKGEGVLSSASEAMVATFKNISYYLPKSISSASSHSNILIYLFIT